MPICPTTQPEAGPTSKKRAVRRLNSGPTHSRDLLVPRSGEGDLARALRERAVFQVMRELALFQAMRERAVFQVMRGSGSGSGAERERAGASGSGELWAVGLAGAAGCGGRGGVRGGREALGAWGVPRGSGGDSRSGARWR